MPAAHMPLVHCLLKCYTNLPVQLLLRSISPRFALETYRFSAAGEERGLEGAHQGGGEGRQDRVHRQPSGRYDREDFAPNVQGVRSDRDGPVSRSGPAGPEDDEEGGHHQADVPREASEDHCLRQVKDNTLP